MIGCCELDLFFDETEMELPVEIEEQINVVFNEEISEELEKIKEQLKETETALENKINELESVKGELTETQKTLSQTQADLTETTENLQAKTEELEEFTEEVNGVKNGLKEVAQSVDPTFITDSTAFVDYPEQFEKVVESAEHFGHTAGVDEENLRWTNLVNSATATADDVAKGKTFVGKYGEIKDGMLDVEAIKEAVRQEEYDKFWDSFQDYGKRTEYNGAFSNNWNDSTFKPKYDIQPEKFGAYSMFSGTLITDLTKCGVNIDFSKVEGNTNYIFSTTKLKHIGIVDFSSHDEVLAQIFFNSTELVTVDQFIINENASFTQWVFHRCFALENITIGGTIGQNGFDIKWSTKLSHDSLISILNALSSTTSGLSVTVSQTAVNKAFETSEGANDGSTSQEWLNLIATKNNWTILLA